MLTIPIVTCISPTPTSAVVSEMHMTMGMVSIQNAGRVGPKRGTASRKK